MGKNGHVVGIASRRSRRVLTMIRGGTIGLRIKTERWRGQPREERTCQSCSSSEIEDAEHWLIRCSVMNHWRQPVFNLLQMHVNNFSELTDENKLGVLLHMSCRNPIITKMIVMLTRLDLAIDITYYV